jgi:hypothetical protein
MLHVINDNQPNYTMGLKINFWLRKLCRDCIFEEGLNCIAI